MSRKILMALSRDTNGDIVDRGGGGTFTPITTGSVVTNRQGKFGNNSIYTDESTYFTYTLTEALGTEDFTLSYWASYLTYSGTKRKSISIGHYDAQIGNSDGHLEPNSTVCIATCSSVYTCYRYYAYNKDGNVHYTNPTQPFNNETDAKEWHHYAVIRYGESFLCFFDGKIISLSSFETHISANDSFDQTTIYIGGPLDKSPSWPSWLEQDLDDICLIKGEALFIDKSNPTSDFLVPSTYLDVRPQTKKIFYNFRVGNTQ